MWTKVQQFESHIANMLWSFIDYTMFKELRGYFQVNILIANYKNHNNKIIITYNWQ